MNKTLIVLILLIFANNVSGAEGVIYFDNTLKITIAASLENTDSVGQLTVKIYDKTNNEIVQERNLTPIPKGSEAIELIFNLNQALSPKVEYETKIYSSGILWKVLKITKLKIEFESSDDFAACKGGIPVFFYGIEDDPDETPGLAEKFWIPILNYFNDENLEKKITASISYGTKSATIKFKSARLAKKDLNVVSASGNTLICLAPITKPSFGNFNISVKFDTPPFSLGGEFIGENLSWGNTTAIKSSDALPDSPDERALEKNLDLGVSFTSAVEIDDTTNLKKRESHGILDVRLAPILNTIKYKGGPWIKKWTPVFLNANVATGKITESTLSLNRIIFGSEFEFRYIPSLKSPSSGKRSDTRAGFIDYYRLKFSGNHASDRDFKQKEVTGKGEFQPVWAILNKPRDTRWRYVSDKITGNPIVEYNTFGWEIIPKIGFEFGKTYSRRNPASAITESEFIKRIYGGLEMKFDITSHLSLKIEDVVYSRYELKSNRLKNLFKSEIYAPLGSPFRRTSNGLFLSFEKGDAPPFTNTVNVVKFGYRIQSNEWGRF